MNNEEIVQEIQNGINVKDNMKKLYLDNKRFIYKAVKKYKWIEDIEDLMQYAYIALDYCVKTYDVSKGLKFLTYAGDTISQLVYRQLQMSGLKGMYVPIHMLDACAKHDKFCKQYVAKYGKMPGIFEESESLGFSEVQIISIRHTNEIMNNILSVDAIMSSPDGMGDTLCMLDLLSSDDAIEEECIDRVFNSEIRDVLKICLNELLPDERRIITRMYIENRTAEEVGYEMGYSLHKVAGIKKRALFKMGRNKEMIAFKKQCLQLL